VRVPRALAVISTSPSSRHTLSLAVPRPPSGEPSAVHNRSRFPLTIAVLLGLVAALLLWWRPREDSAQAHVPAPSMPATSRSSAGSTPSTAQVPHPTPALQTPATPEDGAFRVRVVSAGRPIEGARVQAYLRGPDDGTGETPWRRAGQGTTGGDGTLRLPAAPGEYLLSATAEGHGPTRREMERPAGEAETQVELSLPAGVELRGRVIAGGSGEAVSPAEVSLHPYPGAVRPGSEALEVPEETALAASDPQGRFTFTGLSPGRYALSAEAPGFSRRTMRVVTVPHGGELEVRMWGSSVLEGFVVGEDGQPVADAEVMAIGEGQVPRTTTGPGGGYSLEVSNGTWLLVARKGERMGRLPEPVSATPGETLRELRITLAPASGLDGTVTAAGGTPVPGARLVASPAGKEGFMGQALTDSQGRYTLDLPPGDYDVVALATGLTGAVRDGLAVGSGQRVTVDFQLDGTGAVEGRVADVDGRPLAGVYVSARARQGPGTQTRTTRTDPGGAYRLEGLEAGMVRVSARREGTEHHATRVTSLKAGETAQVDFSLADTGIVQGQVRQASGAPLSQPALVRAMATQAQPGIGEFSYADTDAEGRYQLELPAGVYQLIAVVPGVRFNFSHQDDLAVTVQAGTAVLQDLTLYDDRGVEGTVQEPSGAPSPYATVAGIQTGDFEMTIPAQADEEGRFVLPPRGINATPLRLVAHNAGRVGEVAEAREGLETTVRLRPAATLRGRVVARSGAAPKGFSLQLLQADGSALPWLVRGNAERHFTGDTFTLADAPGLPLRVSVRTTDGRTGEATVTLEPGQRAEVEVPLTGGAASISGRAVWKSGELPATAVAIYLDKQLTAGSDAQTGPDGRFLLKDVKPGVHIVRLLPPNGMPEKRPVTVASGEAVDLGDISVTTRRAEPGTVGAGFSEDRGWVSVAWLTPEGPAAKAGVRVGDRLLAVDGQVVRSRQEAEQRTRGTPGSPIQLGLRREDGQEHQLQLTRAD
jgi:hypothetical protein